MKDKFEAFEIITQRPAKRLNVKNAKCPFCKSKNYQSLRTATTLLGIDSLNHVWYNRACNDCGEHYTVESKGNNVWVTNKQGHVMKGMPSCYEHYTYDCKCGGKVTRHYTDMEGKPVSTLSSTIIDGNCTRHYKTFYQCIKCDVKVQTKFDYYSNY